MALIVAILSQAGYRVIQAEAPSVVWRSRARAHPT